MQGLFICFVNVFFTPIISLAVYSKRKGIRLGLRANCVVSFCISTAANLLVTRFFAVVTHAVFHKNAGYDSVIYTFLSMVSALIIALSAELLEKYCADLKETEIEK